ncbi:MAG TPA: hypothetical protein DEO70_02205 [Bacteroidales bacterium]|nr:MAG: hypothetical protein A2X11_05880 [Bacteroidetes bacterium GWE2_42_24]OFY28329.1 MAG: hypothetical protein A2X09_14590 [Bacteroidetes bacterium GWF2_43_11]HBZ65621.1 hypothetical protein [Bacteroidales bacterium]
MAIGNPANSHRVIIKLCFGHQVSLNPAGILSLVRAYTGNSNQNQCVQTGMYSGLAADNLQTGIKARLAPRFRKCYLCS